MLKFAIIGSLTENTQDLIDIAKEHGHQAIYFTFKEISFETHGNKFKAMFEGKDICEFDIVIFRGYNRHIYEAQLLAEMLAEQNKTFIEQTLLGGYVRGKTQQAKRLAQHGINHPLTFQANSLEGWMNILPKMEFPIIAKPILGRKGRGIQKLNTIQEAEEFFDKNSHDYLAQQYFPIVSDYRVLVVGGKVVGCIQRFINDGEYKSNIRGTRAEKIEISKKMEKIAIDSANAMGYEIAGVDLFEYSGELYIIEVNVAPQWEKLKLVTGINPAESIIQYAIEKHLKK